MVARDCHEPVIVYGKMVQTSPEKSLVEGLTLFTAVGCISSSIFIRRLEITGISPPKDKFHI